MGVTTSFLYAMQHCPILEFQNDNWPLWKWSDNQVVAAVSLVANSDNGNQRRLLVSAPQDVANGWTMAEWLDEDVTESRVFQTLCTLALPWAELQREGLLTIGAATDLRALANELDTFGFQKDTPVRLRWSIECVVVCDSGKLVPISNIGKKEVNAICFVHEVERLGFLSQRNDWDEHKPLLESEVTKKWRQWKNGTGVHQNVGVKCN